MKSRSFFSTQEQEGTFFLDKKPNKKDSTS